MLNGEARRAASILHQTPGWRWRRKLCLTERSQQRQSGPWWTAWFHDRCNRVDRDACRRGNVMTRVRHRQSTCKKQCQTLERNACRRGNVGRMRVTSGHVRRALPELHGQGGRVRVAPARTRFTREWTALFQRTWQTTELQRQETRGQHRLGTRRWQRQSECG